MPTTTHEVPAHVRADILREARAHLLSAVAEIDRHFATVAVSEIREAAE